MERAGGEIEIPGIALGHRTLMERFPDAIFVIGRGLRVRYVNEAAAAMFGAGAADLVGRSLTELFPPDRFEEQRRRLERVFETGAAARAESRIAFPRGGMWLDTHLVPLPGDDGRVGAVMGVSRDVTGVKRVEVELREANARLEMAQRAAGSGVWDWDIATGTLAWSDQLYRLFGLDSARDAASFETWRRLLHPEDREGAEERILAAVRDHVPLENEYRIVLRSGETRWVLALGDTVYDAEGEPLRMTGICLDRTERKLAQEGLRLTHEQLIAAQGPRGPGAWEWDIERGVITWSRELRRMFCFPEEAGAPTFETWSALLHPEDRDAAVAAVHEAVRACRRLESEYRVILATGAVRWYLSVADVACHPDGRPLRMFGISLDITERKALEEALRARSMQLARLTEELVMTEHRERRRLAELLHDDLQQLLVGARMQVGALLAGDVAGVGRERLETVVRILEEALGSARSITQDLAPPVLLHRDLGLAVAWLVEEMRDRHRLHVVARVDEGLGSLSEHLTLLLYGAAREFLLNVVKHAGTSRADLRLRRVSGRIELRVKDLGAGFDPAILARAAGGGGFGLLNIRERAELIGGRLSVESGGGRARGTRVTLTVPIAGTDVG